MKILKEVIIRYQTEDGRIVKAYEQGELVRCKDCKHRDPEDKKCDSGHGIMWQLPRPDDWHCADGKRKEE